MTFYQSQRFLSIDEATEEPQTVVVILLSYK